ncbi:hypothetical protein PHYBOEH_004273 [Phytophthora boehmeriae]|uniref:Uncharacterized protein n=1 Tax=Phytophthora boehmeriae TaxID=109152 RepID=A0A8T1WNU5_9STRA|nr:hypothetical protein PHYBOEH_004273 [Phytophthora boehmeriae]
MTPTKKTNSILKVSPASSKPVKHYLSIIVQHQRREDSIKPLQLKSSLTADQTAAIATAMKAIVSPNSATDDLEVARQREHRRRYMIKYRARERLVERRLEREIVALRQTIQRLQMQKVSRGQLSQQIKTIEVFHLSLQMTPRQQQVPDVRMYQQVHGCLPAIQALSDLEREEFDSMESLKLHWLWYRSQFREFVLSIQSYAQLEAAEHVIVKATGTLRVAIDCHSNQSKMIVCPVRQQFEFEDGKQLVRRITSEVDLIGAVATAQEHLDPVGWLGRYCSLSETFCKANISRL